MQIKWPANIISNIKIEYKYFVFRLNLGHNEILFRRVILTLLSFSFIFSNEMILEIEKAYGSASLIVM